MSGRRSFSVFGILVAALVLSLIVDHRLHGPVRQRLDRFWSSSAESVATPHAEGLIARVYSQPIHRSQLERAIREKACSAQQALDELIDDELLRQRLEQQPDRAGLSLTPAEVDESMRRFESKFESPEALVSALKSEGFSDEAALRDHLAQTLRLEKLISLSTVGDSHVSNVETRQWFDQHAAALATPERLQARQVFLATLDREPQVARQKLEAALADLKAGTKDFATLVAELSEDEGSKPQAGDLGWMTRERLPEDFSRALFELKPGEPTLIVSKLGWHLVEITARKSAAPADFGLLRLEIWTALSAQKKSAAIRALRQKLRKDAAGHIEIFLS
jgi:parvulin-like peptidyl-prolyl isomerase